MPRKRTVLAVGPVVLLVLLLGVAATPHLVYDQFIWQYFWGPIVADAGTGSLADCPAHIPETPTADIACHNGVVAHSGYTLISELGYGLVLIYALFALVTVLRRLDIGSEHGAVLYFVPFIVGGGMLRVVEDVAAAHPDLLGHPLRYLLISPIIYLTMFGIVFGTVLFGVALNRRGTVTDYKHVVAGVGTVFAVFITGFILSYSTVTAWWMFPMTVGGAAVVLFIYRQVVHHVTGFHGGLHRVVGAEGTTVLYGHLLDGVSTAVSLDVLGMVEKHPVPRTLIAYTGTPYMFVVAKVAVITGILVYMDDELRSDDPLFFNLILLGILAVGMGPGVRNMTRAMFGV